MNETPAQWLIAEYEATDVEDYTGDDAVILGPGRSVYVQPLFTLKSVTAPCHAMRVTAKDYADPNWRPL